MRLKLVLQLQWESLHKYSNVNDVTCTCSKAHEGTYTHMELKDEMTTTTIIIMHLMHIIIYMYIF